MDVAAGNDTGDHKLVELPLEGSGQGGLGNLVLLGAVMRPAACSHACARTVPPSSPGGSARSLQTPPQGHPPPPAPGRRDKGDTLGPSCGCPSSVCPAGFPTPFPDSCGGRPHIPGASFVPRWAGAAGLGMWESRQRHLPSPGVRLLRGHWPQGNGLGSCPGAEGPAGSPWVQMCLRPAQACTSSHWLEAALLQAVCAGGLCGGRAGPHHGPGGKGAGGLLPGARGRTWT